MLVVDPSWKSFKASSEIISLVTENLGNKMKSAPVKISYPDSHTPESVALEKTFYFKDRVIFNTMKKILKKLNSIYNKFLLF